MPHFSVTWALPTIPLPPLLPGLTKTFTSASVQIQLGAQLPMSQVFNDPQLKDLRRQLRHDRSPAEHILWRYLKGRQLLGLKFRRQHSIGRYIVDFSCPSIRLVVEVDGDSHFEEAQQQRDAIREELMKQFGIRTIRFRNDEVLHDTLTVVERLRVFISSS